MARKHILIPMHIWELEDLSVTERLVASIIHGYTEQGKPCFMTNTGLSKLLRVSRRTVSAAVNKLIDEGYVEPLEGGSKRTLGWKLASRGGGSNCTGGWKPASNRNTESIIDFNTEHNMNEEMKEGERKPLHWQQVRDYFQQLNDQERTNNRSHCEPWAQDFFTYYDARGWKNKHGDISKWRPVALAWYRRCAKNVPQRAVKRFDAVKVRDDIRWHRRRYEGYERNDKPMQAHAELVAIRRLEAQLEEHGYAIDA